MDDDDFDISINFIPYSIIGLVIIGIIFIIIGCNPKYTDTCALYDIFRGNIHKIDINETICSSGIGYYQCWTGYIYASKNVNSSYECINQIIGPTSSMNSVIDKMSGYKISQDVYWIQENNNKCSYPTKNVQEMWTIGVVILSIAGIIAVLILFIGIFIVIVEYFVVNRNNQSSQSKQILNTQEV